MLPKIHHEVSHETGHNRAHSTLPQLCTEVSLFLLNRITSVEY